jgi:hypothetical protein
VRTIVVLVGAGWLLVWSFLAASLAMSDAPLAAAVGLAMAVAGALVASWLCARALSRSHRRWWLSIAAGFGAVALALAHGLLWSVGMVDHRLTGPTSPSGLTVIVAVWDAHPGWSADFYSDVRVLDARGSVVAEWTDDGGQYPSDGPRVLRDSMRWTSPTTLEFTTRFSGTARLIVP